MEDEEVGLLGLVVNLDIEIKYSMTNHVLGLEIDSATIPTLLIVVLTVM